MLPAAALPPFGKLDTDHARDCPSGRFLANAAWLVITALAHNLLRWVAIIGLGATDLVAAKTIRRRLLALPGLVTRTAAGAWCTCHATGLGRGLSERP